MTAGALPGRMAGWQCSTYFHLLQSRERKIPPRDPKTSQLVGDPFRFPSGMKALGDYYHSKGLKYALCA